MDFERAADIINMDVTGRDPGPPPSHVRILGADDLVAYVEGVAVCDICGENFPHDHPEEWDPVIVPNTDSDMVLEDFDLDDDGRYSEYRTYPDAYDETTDTQRDYSLTIRFDAETELEARIVIDTICALTKGMTIKNRHITADLP